MLKIKIIEFTVWFLRTIWMNKLRNMAVFARIVEAGSITRAAESLQLSKSVVSQHLKALEIELGVLLIKRSTRKHTLTSAGKGFYDSCNEINKIAELAWQEVQASTEEPKGVIKITAPNALMDAVIAPAIGKVLKQYPLLTPELLSSDAHADLMSDNIDLAIRVGPSQASNIKQRRIGQFRDVLCGAKKLLDNADINQMMYIANTWQGKQICHVFKGDMDNEVRYETTSLCRANSFYACLALIKEGAGIGLIPDFQYQKVTSTIREVFPALELPINYVYALHTYENHLPYRIKVCIEAIENHFSKLS